MKVAVITPYADEPLEWLHQCHQSVRTQRHPATHYLIADGESRELGGWFSGKNMVLPTRSADAGHTPRLVGCMAAIGRGFDAVAFLDADNWYQPEHIDSLVGLHHESGAPVCTSLRSLHDLEGVRLGVCGNSDGVEFSDTNCCFLSVSFLAQNWSLVEMPDWAGYIGDRIIWQRIRNRAIPTSHSGVASICYRTKFSGHYQAFGVQPPASLGARSLRIENALDRWRQECGNDLSFKVRVVPD